MYQSKIVNRRRLEQAQENDEILRSTQEDVLTLLADNLQIVKWKIDASFAIHPDMKSHTGVYMTLSQGAITSVSKSRK